MEQLSAPLVTCPGCGSSCGKLRINYERLLMDNYSPSEAFRELDVKNVCCLTQLFSPPMVENRPSLPGPIVKTDPTNGTTYIIPKRAGSSLGVSTRTIPGGTKETARAKPSNPRATMSRPRRVTREVKPSGDVPSELVGRPEPVYDPSKPGTPGLGNITVDGWSRDQEGQISMVPIFTQEGQGQDRKSYRVPILQLRYSS